MSYRLSDYRDQFKNAPNPASGSTRVTCHACGQTIASSSEECPFCEVIFSGGTAGDYAEETDGKL